MNQDTVISTTEQDQAGKNDAASHLPAEDYQDASKLQQALLDAGYRRGWPQWVRLECRKMDARIVRQSRCNCCDHRGQECHPYHRGTPRSYVVVAVCPNCGNGSEV